MMLTLLLVSLPLAPVVAAISTLAAPGRLARSAVAACLWSTVVATSFVLADPHRAVTAVGGVELGLAIDRVTALIALTTCAIGSTALAFSARSMRTEPHRDRFLAGSSLLVAATTVVTLASSLALLTVGWVSVSVILTFLVGTAGRSASTTAGIRRIRRPMVIGDLALVAALAIAASAGTTTDLDALGVPGATWRIGPLDAPAADLVAVLLVIAGIARSALVPFHGWLGASLAGPTPLSALLHAGVVNGVGVLAIRTAPTLGASDAAVWILFASGTATAVVATAMMLVRIDVKGALAWSTAGQMGFMAVQVAVGALAAALFHIIGHAWFKAAAFLGAAGSVDRGLAASHLAPGTPLRPSIRIPLAAIVPAAAIAATFALTQPHGTRAGLVVLATFGWFTAFRLADGWLRAAGGHRSGLVVGVSGALLLPAAYVTTITVFERFVDPTLASRGADTLSGVGLSATITVLAATVLVVGIVRFTPGTVGRRVRRRVLAVLVGWSTSPVAAPAGRRTPTGAHAGVAVPAHAASSR